MEHRHQITFYKGQPNEITWEIFVSYEPNYQYIANSHRLVGNDVCWVVTGYATSALAFTSMNNHVVNYIRLIPNATFEVLCHPEETEIKLQVTCASKTWNIQVISGTANPSNGTGKNYNDTVLNCWNQILTY